MNPLSRELLKNRIDEILRVLASFKEEREEGWRGMGVGVVNKDRGPLFYIFPALLVVVW